MTSCFVTVLSCIVIAGCVSSDFAPQPKDPASPTARTAPLPSVASALSPDYDPLAVGQVGDGKDPGDGQDPAVHDHATEAADHPDATGASEAQTYTCPMHPEIVRSEPGTCPICGMKLVPVKPKKDEQAAP